MLRDFLSANRNDLIARCRAKVAKRSAPRPTEAELEDGVPDFLNQLIRTLEAEEQTPRSKTDGQILASALSNLLSNAIKFTRKGGHVALRARHADDRLLIAVEDECGGLPTGEVVPPRLAADRPAQRLPCCHRGRALPTTTFGS
jgi:signal transduction histidine kinase